MASPAPTTRRAPGSTRTTPTLPVRGAPSLSTGARFPENPTGGNILGWPLPRVFYFCSQLSPILAATHQKNPVAANRQRLCNLAGGPVIIGQWHVPAGEWKQME